MTPGEETRLRAAEDVCWTLMLMMGFGMLPIEDQRFRDFLAKPMEVWADEAVKTGVMRGNES